MIGQGSPNSFPRSSSVFRSVFFLILATTVWLSAAARISNGQAIGQTDQRLSQISVSRGVSPVSDTVDSIRLRISWGGGQHQMWKGAISISNGKFSSAAPLGLTPDAPGSVVLANGQLNINHWTPTNYGGADITVEMQPESNLKINLYSADNPEQQYEKTVDLSQLISEGFSETLDEFGNRIFVARVPGDRLPVQFKKDHLVFSPGETFQVGVRANRMQLISRTAKCRLQLQSNSPRSGVNWKEAFSFELDQTGSTGVQWVDVPVPHEEGVYQLKIEMESNWNQASFRAKTNPSRSVEFVVIDPQRREKDSLTDAQWKILARLDPTQQQTKNPLSFSQISNFANGFAKPANRIGNEAVRSIVVDETPMLELLPGGWQALPIDVDKLNRPHVLEIDYVANPGSAFGVSLLQPDATGQIPLYGFDSGVAVPNSVVEIEPNGDGKTRQKHRVVFWPHHKQPYLLIVNRHERNSATIGEIRILSGPERLPEAQSPTSEHVADGRKRMAFYESPLFPENFGVRERFDPTVGQPLDDWQMFYDGADRLIQHLKSNAYQGAFVTVACDGSAIYPSHILSPSPKHDSGTFFASGQDPIRKDVLEMLFRMFQREGLTLVPALAMSGPLPAIEVARANSQSSEQFGLVGYQQQQATWALKNELPVYNPLNRAVQKTVTDVIAEISDRYQTHNSFNGLAVICRPDTYTLLPGRQWGYDSTTAQQFLQTLNDLESVPTQWEEIQQVLLSSHQPQWIDWRCRQMSLWYRSMLATLQSSLPEGSLFIAPVDLYRNEEMHAALTPSLHGAVDYRQQMKLMGFDAQEFSQTDGLELLKPTRVSPNEAFAVKRVETNLKNSTQADKFFALANTSGELFTHRGSWAHFAQLQDQSPFGRQEASIMRLQPLIPAAQWNRQRFLESIQRHDSTVMIDGGWMLAMGQQPEMSEFAKVYRQLPASKFSDVKLCERLQEFSSSTMPVVVRQLQRKDETGETKSWFYAVNVSPWPVTVQLSVADIDNSGDASNAIISLADGTPVSQNSDGKFELKLPALSLAGGKSDTFVAISDYDFELPADAADRLRKQVYSLRAKMVQSTKVQPIQVLENPDYELFGQPSLNGWDVGQQTTANVGLETRQASNGRSSLNLRTSEGAPVWIRSNAIRPPETGRLSISVWLRTDQPEQQPPLRLAVEGKIGTTNYYRFGSVGSLSPTSDANQIQSQWQRFAVHFDDLPIERLSDLKIGFDLMGPGQVHIDQVEVYDRWFDDNDAKAITQRLASCGPLLSNPVTLESCRRLLDDYWLQFLDEFFGESTAESTAEQFSQTASRENAINSEVESAVGEQSVNRQPERNSGSQSRKQQNRDANDGVVTADTIQPTMQENDARSKSMFRRFRRPERKTPVR